MAETLRDRLLAHGWTEEEADGRWKIDLHGRWQSDPDSTVLRPYGYMEDRERWERVGVPLTELLPVGAEIALPEGGGRVKILATTSLGWRVRMEDGQEGVWSIWQLTEDSESAAAIQYHEAVAR